MRKNLRRACTQFIGNVLHNAKAINAFISRCLPCSTVIYSHRVPSLPNARSNIRYGEKRARRREGTEAKDSCTRCKPSLRGGGRGAPSGRLVAVKTKKRNKQEKSSLFIPNFVQGICIMNYTTGFCTYGNDKAE